MKRIITALVATTAFAATPALADNHMEKHGDKEKMDVADKDWTKKSMDSEISAMKASQVFLAIDEENDGLITEAEWSDWQNRSESETEQFADYDADSDGDIELSEYLENFDVS